MHHCEVQVTVCARYSHRQSPHKWKWAAALRQCCLLQGLTAVCKWVCMCLQVNEALFLRAGTIDICCCEVQVTLWA